MEKKLYQLICYALFFVVFGSSAKAQSTWHVKSSGNDVNDGHSWATAFASLQVAIDAANAGDQIWVAAGTYRPTTDNPASIDSSARDKTFYISRNIQLYGGFGGTESILDQRDLNAYPTFMMGGGNPGSDNSYHVLFIQDTSSAENITNDCVIDGFTICDGNANGIAPNDYGGGIYIDGSDPGNEASPIFRNCLFSNNSANVGGAASILAVNNGLSSPLFYNCVFQSNSATLGGAIGTLTGTGGISSSHFINCNFTQNQATNGDAMFNFALLSTNIPQLTNCILWNDDDGNDEIANSDVTPIVSHSIIQGGLFGAMDTDPHFYNASNGDFRLRPGSVAINGGLPDTTSLNLPPTDISGNPRIISDTIDMGVYEDACILYDSTIFVDADANGNGDGTNWVDAFTDLTPAIDRACFCSPNGGVSTIWAAEGTYLPTQPNPAFNSGSIRDHTFYISSDIQLYGGFRGGETDLDERSWVTQPTILSGDIGIPGDSTDNSYHVIFMHDDLDTGITSDCVLDGLVIQDGNADGNDTKARLGGGIFMRGFDLTASESFTDQVTPSIQNVHFRNNQAEFGGAIASAPSSSGDSLKLANCHFKENNASKIGGALYNRAFSICFNFPLGITDCEYGNNYLNIDRCIFENNSSGISAGAIYNNSNDQGVCAANITNSEFIGNSTVYWGGAIQISGSLGEDEIAKSALKNNSFSGNKAAAGGAISQVGSSNKLSLDITNCSFAGNRATAGGGAIYNSAGDISIVNTILWNNDDEIYENINGGQFSIRNSIFQDSVADGSLDLPIGVINGGSNADNDPQFKNMDGPDGILGTLDDNLQVLGTSPAINGGTLFIYGLNLPNKDLANNPRVLESRVDIGAYERHAAGVLITFRVNMIDQTVSPAGVHVAGSFQSEAGFTSDWLPGVTEMFDLDMDGIYERTVSVGSVVPGDTFQYKFINGNSWSPGVGEVVPSDCGIDDGGGIINRFGILLSTDMVLDMVCFGRCGPYCDQDGDGVPDNLDVCPGSDDMLDVDQNGLPDACDCNTGSEVIQISNNNNTMTAIVPQEYHTYGISSNGRVSSSETVGFGAATSITLTSGFQVDLNGSFRATIINCPTGNLLENKNVGPTTSLTLTPVTQISDLSPPFIHNISMDLSPAPFVIPNVFQTSYKLESGHLIKPLLPLLRP